MKKLFISVASLGLGLMMLTSCSSSDSRSSCKEALKQVVNALESKEKNNLNSNKIDGYSAIAKTDDFVEITDYYNVTATKTFIKYTELLYENETYPITDKIVYSTATLYNGENPYEYNVINQKTSMDKSNNKLYFELYGGCGSGKDMTSEEFYNNFEQNGEKFYLNLDIEFDYSNNELLGFSIYGAGDYNGNLDPYIILVYENNKLYELELPTKNKETLNTIKASYNDSFSSFKNQMNDKIIAGDYSKEFTDVTLEFFGESYFK